jgi:ADP-heptose:LPS heptosyltransferase
MGIKKIIKRMGRSIFFLKQADDSVIMQSILIVDNGYSHLAGMRIAIRKIQNYFPGSKISVLTLAYRSSVLQNEFPELEFIICSQKLNPHRYRIALQLLFLRKQNFDYILNFSLDLSPLIVQLCLFKSKIILYNQWGQWCSLRLRKVSEVFKVAYNKQRSKNNFKDFLKRIGLFLVLLIPDDAQALSQNILIADDSLVGGQLIFALRRIKEHLPFARVTILTSSKRDEIKDELAVVRVIKSDEFWFKKYRIARHMLKLRKNNYDYVILFSLDITPVIVSVLLMQAEVLLNNRWHQWWRVNFKPAKYYFILIPRLVLNLIIQVVIFIYLLISVAWIFLMRAFNIFKINLLREGN